MCGIFGTNILKKELLESMSKNLIHRGPEETKYYLKNDRFAMGINRLATIGLSVEYPLEYKNRHLVFNGDIFNYKEIREELKRKGHKFKTDSDGEVIVVGYDEYGPTILDKLRGQFAIMLLDANKKELFVARDRFGICPLYLVENIDRYTEGWTFAIASEIKAFKGIKTLRLDNRHLKYYLNFDCVPAPYTLIQDITKFEPGWYYNIDLTENKRNITKKKYWNPSFKSDESYTYSEKETYDRIKQAVTLGAIADFPVGAYLSGGVDSSTVVAFLSKINKKLHTFSVHFKSDTVRNELTDAKIVADYYNTIHHELHLGKEILNDLPQIIYYMDEPIPNMTALAQYNLSELVKQNGIKIVLDGTGGDELFGGYTFQNRLVPLGCKLDKLRFMRFLSGVIPKTSIKQLNYAKSIIPVLGNAQEIYNKLVHSGRVDVKDIYSRYSLFGCDLDIVNRVIQADIMITLNNQYLHLSDRMSMAHGVVSRPVLLDYVLAEYAFKLPISQKITSNESKVMMKRAMKQLLPPSTLIKQKSGFVAPLKEWWPEIREYTKEYLPNSIYLHAKTNQEIKEAFRMTVLKIWIKIMDVKE